MHVARAWSFWHKVASAQRRLVCLTVPTIHRPLIPLFPRMPCTGFILLFYQTASIRWKTSNFEINSTRTEKMQSSIITQHRAIRAYTTPIRRSVPSISCNAASAPAPAPRNKNFFNTNPFVIRLSAAAASMINRIKEKAAAQASSVDEAQLNQQIKESVKHMRTLAIIAPFAAVSGSADTFFIITKAVASFIKVCTRSCLLF